VSIIPLDYDYIYFGFAHAYNFNKTVLTAFINQYARNTDTLQKIIKGKRKNWVKGGKKSGGIYGIVLAIIETIIAFMVDFVIVSCYSQSDTKAKIKRRIS
jgi:hypothetical protein